MKTLIRNLKFVALAAVAFCAFGAWAAADLVIHEGGNVTYGGGSAATYTTCNYYAITNAGDFGDTVSAIRTMGNVANPGMSVTYTGVRGIDNGEATLKISSMPGGIAITNAGWIGAINQQSSSNTSGMSDLDVQGVGDITVKATGNYVSGGKTLYYAAKGIGIYMAKNTDIAQNKVTVGAKSLTVEAEGTAYAIQGCLGGRTVRIDIEGDVNIRGVGVNSQAYGSNFTAATPVGHMDLNFGSLTVSSEGVNSTFGLLCAGGATANVVLNGDMSVSAPNATATGFRLAGNANWSLKGKDGKAIDIILSGTKGLGGQFGGTSSTAKLSLDVNTFAVTGTTTTAQGLDMSGGTPSVTGTIRTFTVSAKGDATAIDAPYGNVDLVVGTIAAVSTEGAARAICAKGGMVSVGGIAGQPVSMVGDVEVASASTLTFSNAVNLVGNVTNDGTIAIGPGGLAVTGAISNTGTLTVDMTGATEAKYTLITATEPSVFGTCQFADGKDNGYLLRVEGNSLVSEKPPCTDCITFSASEPFGIKMWKSGIQSLTPALEWSTNQVSWETFSLENGAAAGTDNKLYLRGKGNEKLAEATSKYYAFTNTANSVATAIACSGNIMTLLDYEKVAKGENPTMADYAFCGLFSGFAALTEAPTLPATNLTGQCYVYMFQDCTSLTEAPALQATNLANQCYLAMFSGCISLTKAPELQATILATQCYRAMFYGCTSLTEAPALPATILTNQCYTYMFKDCTSLTEAPALPATNLATQCYNYMFNGCTSLTEAPALPATNLATQCYASMFNGCTSLTEAPALPATNLATQCYASMFYRCTSLEVNTNAPGKVWSVPAEAVTANNWNSSMFRGSYGNITNTTVTPGVTYYVASAPATLTAVTKPDNAEVTAITAGGTPVSVPCDITYSTPIEVTYTADSGYVFPGGSPTFTTNLYANADVVTVTLAAGQLPAPAPKEDVIEVIVGGTTNKYTSLEEAWKAAQQFGTPANPATIRLMKDIKLTNTLETVKKPID